MVQQRVVESNVRPAQNITHHWDISFGNRDVYRRNREPVSGRRIRHARAAEGEFAPMHFVMKFINRASDDSRAYLLVTL